MRVPLSIVALCFAVGCGDLSLTTCDYGYTTSSKGAELAINSVDFGGSSIAQSFSLPASDDNFSLQSVRVRLKKSGTFDPADTITLSVRSDSSSVPATTTLASADTLVSSLASTAFNAREFTFSSAISLTPETVYWIHLTSSYPQSDEDLVFVQAHQGSSGEYTSGKAIYETSVPNIWSDALIGTFRDLIFQFNCSDQ